MSIYKIPEKTNIEITAQRTDIAHFMDVTNVDGITPEAEGDTVWKQLGSGWTSMTESPSAQTKDRKFINEKSKRKNITSYSPSFAFEALLMFKDPAIRKVYDIYTKRKTGTAAVVGIVTDNQSLASSSDFLAWNSSSVSIPFSFNSDSFSICLRISED